MHNWEYSPLVARTELVRLIARLDIPISLGDLDAFVEYITNAHNPKYKSVSRQTTTRDITKYFTDKKAKLVESFASAGVNYVCLTSDILVILMILKLMLSIPYSCINVVHVT
jgi:hypothetical protein